MKDSLLYQLRSLAPQAMDVEEKAYTRRSEQIGGTFIEASRNHTGRTSRVTLDNKFMTLTFVEAE